MDVGSFDDFNIKRMQYNLGELISHKNGPYFQNEKYSSITYFIQNYSAFIILQLISPLLLMIFRRFRKLGQYHFSSTEPDPSYNFKRFQCHTQLKQLIHHNTFTYFRQVLSCTLDPTLIDNETLNLDARRRAKQILQEIISVGSYTEPGGIDFVRDSICKFIKKIDRVDLPCRDEVILTQGAERALNMVLHTLIVDDKDAVMIPAPNYPLHGDIIKLNGGTVAEYCLDEQKRWDIDMQDLQNLVVKLKLAGKRPKAIVIINPGNPTGHTFSSQTLTKLLQFSVTHHLLVIADEVFRQNIYNESTTFRSCRSILETLSAPTRENCELISIHSASKGFIMAPGLRGGYLYLHNISPFVIQQLHKYSTFYGCSNTIGQLMVDLMVNPFEGMSDTTKSSFLAEYEKLKKSIRHRGRVMADALKEMDHVNCQYAVGSTYIYPSVRFSKQAVAEAEGLGRPVDQFYCHQIQQNTGTALMPGSTFNQPQGSHHFRISPCLFSEQQLPIFLQKLKKSNSQFHRKYAN